MKDFTINIIYFIIISLILHAVKSYLGFESAAIIGLAMIITDVYEIRRNLKS